MSSRSSDSPPRGAHDADRALKLRSLALLIAAILLGVLLGLQLLERAFVRIPTDVRRLGVLLDSLQRTTPSPGVVVFGNSVLMSGIDARELSSGLDGQPLAWNCASPGQSLLEAYLLTQELPAAVALAVYGVAVTAGEADSPLNAQKYNTLFMYGFRPDAETLATVRSLYDESVLGLLERSKLAQVFASRWAVRQFVDTQVRVLLRSDLALDTATFDLFHPQTYERPIDPAITARFVARRLEAFATRPAAVSASTVELARRIAREAGSRGRRSVFLFPPIHPDILVDRARDIRAAVDAFAQALSTESAVAIVDASDLLERSHFIDDAHPTDEGARILTRHVARSLLTIR